MTLPKFAPLMLVLALAACGPEPVRYFVPEVAAGDRIGVPVASIEVRQVSLPAYAESEEIWLESPEGGLRSDSAILWADDPTRGMTLDLSRQLSALTNARVAAQPWPFDALAQAIVEVRVDEMVAGADGRFRLSGQFYVARRDGGRERSQEFKVSAPYSVEAGVTSVAAARANAVRDLSRLIAKDGF